MKKRRITKKEINKQLRANEKRVREIFNRLNVIDDEMEELEALLNGVDEITDTLAEKGHKLHRKAKPLVDGIYKLIQKLDREEMRLRKEKDRIEDRQEVLFSKELSL